MLEKRSGGEAPVGGEGVGGSVALFVGSPPPPSLRRGALHAPTAVPPPPIQARAGTRGEEGLGGEGGDGPPPPRPPTSPQPPTRHDAAASTPRT